MSGLSLEILREKGFTGELPKPSEVEVYAVVEDPDGIVVPRSVVAISESGKKLVFVGGLTKFGSHVGSADVDEIMRSSKAKGGWLENVKVLKFGAIAK